jgi:hypothetical protein
MRCFFNAVPLAAEFEALDAEVDGTLGRGRIRRERKIREGGRRGVGSSGRRDVVGDTACRYEDRRGGRGCEELQERGKVAIRQSRFGGGGIFCLIRVRECEMGSRWVFDG